MKLAVLTGVVGAALWVQIAAAQIVSQTPSPDIPNPEDTELQTVTPVISQGHKSGTGGVQIPRSGALLFAGFDQNADYIIDSAEVEIGIKRAFKTADSDKDDLLSLVELESWRAGALGSENATPTQFTFAPNFARSVSREKFSAVLNDIAQKLDANDRGERDGKIGFADLLQDYRAPRTQRQKSDNCATRIRNERRRVEQQCRAGRR